MVVIRAEINKKIARIANRKDLEQTASSQSDLPRPFLAGGWCLKFEYIYSTL